MQTHLLQVGGLIAGEAQTCASSLLPALIPPVAMQIRYCSCQTLNPNCHSAD
jgi:hypothetical protein